MSSERNRSPGLDRRRLLSALGAGGILAGALPGQTAGQSQTETPASGPEREAAERGARRRAENSIRVATNPNGLNLVVIVADTWRSDHIGAYGGTQARTPVLDSFAEQSVLFENNYADGLPTIPARRVYHTGKSIIPGSQWIPLPAGEVTLAQILEKHGYRTGLVSDVYHYFKPDMNMHVGFDTWQWIRGQESDPYLGGPLEQFQPREHMPAGLWNPAYDRNMRQYMMNTQHWEGEDDYFCARTVQAASEWLEMNATNSPFMLWVEMFDPHEPWDPPPRFARMYRDDYGYDRFLFGYGVQNAQVRPDFEPYLPVIRDLYRAEVTFTDHCIGRLLEKLEELKLLDDTVVVFTSDHGTHLGEEGYVQKQAALLNQAVMHVPLIVRHPDRATARRRVSALTSAVDYAPTFCSLLGIHNQEQMEGEDMWRLVTGDTESLRDWTYSQFSRFASIRNHDWHYFQHLSGQDPGAGPALYDLRTDPRETANVLNEHPDVGAEMAERLADRMQQRLPVTAGAS